MRAVNTKPTSNAVTELDATSIALVSGGRNGYYLYELVPDKKPLIAETNAVDNNKGSALMIADDQNGVSSPVDSGGRTNAVYSGSSASSMSSSSTTG